MKRIRSRERKGMRKAYGEEENGELRGTKKKKKIEVYIKGKQGAMHLILSDFVTGVVSVGISLLFREGSGRDGRTRGSMGRKGRGTIIIFAPPAHRRCDGWSPKSHENTNS